MFDLQLLTKQCFCNCILPSS